MPKQSFFVADEFQMLEFAATQLRIKRSPLHVEFGEQGVKRCINRLAEPRNIQCLESVRLGFHGHQIICKTTVLNTVIEVDVPRVQASTQLSIHPKLVAIPAQADGVAMLIKVQQKVA